METTRIVYIYAVSRENQLCRLYIAFVVNFFSFFIPIFFFSS